MLSECVSVRYVYTSAQPTIGKKGGKKDGRL